jgi:uncharacterized protein YjbJ (UPF0337 family)
MGELSKKAKGRIEQAVGGLTGNKRLQNEGQDDERAGQVEGAVTDVQHAVKGAVKDAKHALKEVSK